MFTSVRMITNIYVWHYKWRDHKQTCVRAHVCWARDKYECVCVIQKFYRIIENLKRTHNSNAIFYKKVFDRWMIISTITLNSVIYIYIFNYVVYLLFVLL